MLNAPRERAAAAKASVECLLGDLRNFDQADSREASRSTRLTGEGMRRLSESRAHDHRERGRRTSAAWTQRNALAGLTNVLAGVEQDSALLMRRAKRENLVKCDREACRL